MIVTKIRLQEQHPMSRGATSWPLSPCDLNLDYTAGENGYLVKAIQGIGPPDLVSVVEGFDTAGIPIMGSIPQQRDIALRIELKPGLGQSNGSLRDDLYKYMSRSITVSMMYGSIVIAEVKGFISKFETSHFTKQPEVQLTIQCETGDFVAPKSVPIPTAILNTLTPNVNYEDGTAPTGLNIQFTVTANHSNLTISNYAKLWYPGVVSVNNIFTVTYNFLIGDVVTIATTPKERRITVLRSSVTTDLAGYISAGAVWPMLYPGVNSFDWTLASSWMTFVYANYVPRYWGV